MKSTWACPRLGQRKFKLLPATDWRGEWSCAISGRLPGHTLARGGNRGLDAALQIVTRRIAKFLLRAADIERALHGTQHLAAVMIGAAVADGDLRAGNG